MPNGAFSRREKIVRSLQRALGWLAEARSRAGMPDGVHAAAQGAGRARREGRRKGRIAAILGFCILSLAAGFGLTSFYQQPANTQKPTVNCSPDARPFYGYTFLYPEIINKDAAYAPFFLRWDDYYQQYYFNKDIQKDENIKEWIERFCGQPEADDVGVVVYESNFDELVRLRNAALDKNQKTPLPHMLAGNTFAEMLVLNGCTEAIDYLMFAKKCEPFVIAQGDGWTIPERDPEAMYELINEGMGRFGQTTSNFIRLRYAYQIIRLAHYARGWEYTISLYNYLIPKIDLKKPSIIYYWIIGHVAGAQQKMGKYPEAAYRYSMVFRHCASKRIQAWRSFLIRNDQDWAETMKLCQDNAERATLYAMRAGGSHTRAAEDMEQIYDLDPHNPQLELLVVSDIQELEKIILRTRVTDLKYGQAVGDLKRQNTDKHLLDLQKFVRRVVREKKASNLKLWRAMEGYLELLAGDRYAAATTWDRLVKNLDNDEEADRNLEQQVAIWRCLLDIMNLDTLPGGQADSVAYRVRSLNVFRQNPNLEPFLQDWLAQDYAVNAHPGKAVLAAWGPTGLKYNPSLAVLDDLLKLADSNDPILLERTMMMDTSPDRIRADLLELKGAYLLGLGQPEAALATLRKIKPSEEIRLTRFSPFREKVGEKIHREVYDTLFLTRRQIAEKIVDFEFRAKAAAAENDPVAGWYYYLIGLGYYNMSYFGYEWEVTDFYRSGYNQLRLAQGPVFSLRNTPAGNRENTDMSIALAYFEKAINTARNPEMAARAAFMAARCRQKQWFCDKDCTYRPGSALIPVLPEPYMDYYNLLMTRYADTKFYGLIVQECKWLEAYARR